MKERREKERKRDGGDWGNRERGERRKMKKL